MNVEFHPEAEAELNGAVTYYNQKENGLGYVLLEQIMLTLERIEDYPKASPTVDNGIHRCLVNRFPYGILYSVKRDLIYILAIMHLRRPPGYWRKRVD